MSSWLIVALQPAVVALVQLAVTAAALHVAVLARAREKRLAARLRSLGLRPEPRRSKSSSNTPRRTSRRAWQVPGRSPGARPNPSSKD